MEADCGVILVRSPQYLLVQPAIDDAFSKAPLFPEFGGWNALLLSPLVNRLRCEAQVGGDLLECEDLVIVHAQRRGVVSRASGALSNGSGCDGARGAGASAPWSSLFAA